MIAREILAYAITHAPPGVKGGPYEGCGVGEMMGTLALAQRYEDAADAHEDASWLARNGHTARVIRIVRARPSAEPTQQPSEVTPARLRAIADRLESRLCAPSLAGYDFADGLRAAADLLDGEPGPDVHRDYTAGGPASPRVSLATYAECEPAQQPREVSAVEVLRELASYPGNGGDLARIQARARRVLAASGPDPSGVVRAAMRFTEHCTPALEGSAWFVATREFIDAVDAYRKAGGK